MKRCPLLFTASLLGIAACATTPDPDLKLDWQIRWPSSLTLAKPLSIHFVRDNTAVAQTMNRNWVKSEGAYSFYEWSDSPTPSARRFLVVQISSEDIARVFPIEPSLKNSCAQWTQWREPTYVQNDSGDAHWKLLDGHAVVTTSDAQPRIEARFRVSSWAGRC